MDAQIKKTVKAGNSSAVILPRGWLNKEVRVELVKKTYEMILTDVIDILRRNVSLKRIIGVYLAGSYARGEEDCDSDIDILTVTDGIDREMIKEGPYNILIISSELIRQKLNRDLFPVGQMIREAKPLINSSYLGSIEVKVTKRNISWYIKTTKDKLEMIKQIIDITKKENKKYLDDAVAYTLVLRIRTLHIINKLVKNKNYSSKEFIRIINAASKGKNAYERYLAMKNNLKKKRIITLEEAENLYKYLKSQLEEIGKLEF